MIRIGESFLFGEIPRKPLRCAWPPDLITIEMASDDFVTALASGCGPDRRFLIKDLGDHWELGPEIGQKPETRNQKPST